MRRTSDTSLNELFRLSGVFRGFVTQNGSPGFAKGVKSKAKVAKIHQTKTKNTKTGADQYMTGFGESS
jgi:hypothetical protein